MSSLESPRGSYDADDWQLVQSEQPYEDSKLQTDLVCAELARRAGLSPTAAARHITVHPGVVNSSIDAALIGSFSAQAKLVILYLVRCLFHPPSFSTVFAEFWVGALVRFNTPQYLDVEWCCCCRPRLPSAAGVYSDPSICIRDTCIAREDEAGSGRTGFVPRANAFRHRPHGAQ